MQKINCYNKKGDSINHLVQWDKKIEELKLKNIELERRIERIA